MGRRIELLAKRESGTTSAQGTGGYHVAPWIMCSGKNGRGVEALTFFNKSTSSR